MFHRGRPLPEADDEDLEFIAQAAPPLVWLRTTGELSGHIAELLTDDGSGRDCKLRVCGESTSRCVRRAKLRPVRPTLEPNEVVMTSGCSSEVILTRLLEALEWGDAAQALQPEIVSHILSFLAVRRVDHEDVKAVCASSLDVGPLCSLPFALEQTCSNWWISGEGSMPRGVGAEWIAFALSADGQPRRVERIDMRIPPLPSGPLSVRNFHLETAAAADGPWTRASREYATLNVGEVQSWAVSPPIESGFVRVMCLRNAARAKSDLGESRARFLPISTSVGFFHVRFR